MAVSAQALYLRVAMPEAIFLPGHLDNLTARSGCKLLTSEREGKAAWTALSRHPLQIIQNIGHCEHTVGLWNGSHQTGPEADAQAYLSSRYIHLWMPGVSNSPKHQRFWVHLSPRRRQREVMSEPQILSPRGYPKAVFTGHKQSKIGLLTNVKERYCGAECLLSLYPPTSASPQSAHFPIWGLISPALPCCPCSISNAHRLQFSENLLIVFFPFFTLSPPLLLPLWLSPSLSTPSLLSLSSVYLRSLPLPFFLLCLLSNLPMALSLCLHFSHSWLSPYLSWCLAILSTNSSAMLT